VGTNVGASQRRKLKTSREKLNRNFVSFFKRKKNTTQPGKVSQAERKEAGIAVSITDSELEYREVNWRHLTLRPRKVRTRVNA
jgi:hypothetical protein